MKEIVTEVEVCRAENNQLRQQLDLATQLNTALDAKFASLASQLSTMVVDVSEMKQRVAGYASLPAATDANTAAITELLANNQVFHDALTTLTTSLKATSSQFNQQFDALTTQ